MEKRWYFLGRKVMNRGCYKCGIGALTLIFVWADSHLILVALMQRSGTLRWGVSIGGPLVLQLQQPWP